MIKTMLKGSPEYTVVRDGKEIARAHCVQVQAGTFTVVIRGRWAGIMSEVQAITALQAL